MNREEITLYKDLLNDTKEQLAHEIIQKNRELDKLDELEYIRYKAIEYIKERYDEEVLTHTFDKDNVKELLDILKGSDKE